MSSAGSNVSRNFYALSGGEVGARLIAFVGTVYAARTLGSAAFGMVALALAFCTNLSIGVTAGLHEIGARQVAHHPKDAPAIAANVIGVRLLLALLAFMIVLAVALQLDKPPIVRLVFILVGLSLFPVALDTSWLFKGLGRMKPAALALVSAQFLMVAAILTFIRGPEDVAFLPIATLLGESSAAIFLGILVLRMGFIKPDLRAGFEMLKTAMPLAITKVFRALIFTFDVILLSFLMGDADVGVYSASYRICFFLLAISIALAHAYLPRFVASKDDMSTVLADALEFGAWVGLPIVVGGMILAEPLLDAVFGPEYVAGAPAFRILLGSIGIIFLYAPIHNALLVLKKIREETRFMGVAASVNIGLNILLIPQFGLAGAATATVVAEVIILFAGALYLRHLGYAPQFTTIVRPLILTALMAVFVLAMLSFGLIAGVAIGALAYGGLTLLFGFVPRDVPELSNLREDIRRWARYRLVPRFRKSEKGNRNLRGREAYKLYDDVYRQIEDGDVKTIDLFGIDKARSLIYADIYTLIESGQFAPTGSNVIDLGCGDGGNAIHMTRMGYQVTGVDVSSAAIQIATGEALRQNVSCKFRVDDVTTLATCQDASFDAATSFGVLHMLVYASHRAAYLQSARRILRPGGRFLLFEFVSGYDGAIEDEEEHVQDSVSHVDLRRAGDDVIDIRGSGFRGASASQYQEELVAAGFELVEQHGAWSHSIPFGMILVRAI